MVHIVRQIVPAVVLYVPVLLLLQVLNGQLGSISGGRKGVHSGLDQSAFVFLICLQFLHQDLLSLALSGGGLEIFLALFLDCRQFSGSVPC